MTHNKYPEVKTLVEHNINVLLTGQAGSGKTTLLRQVAEELDLPFYAVSMTKQVTLNALLGFMSINGNYVPSSFRNAVENGGMFLMDEIDASDPNVILSLNTLENGFVAFPDKVVNVHPNFRWVATANPFNAHHIYTGRAKLDGATLDRFDIIEVGLDTNLEISLVGKETWEEVQIMRQVLSDNNSSKTVSMRDAIRLSKRKELDLAADYVETLLEEDEFVSEYVQKLTVLRPLPPKEQSECTTLDELKDSVIRDSHIENNKETE